MRKRPGIGAIQKQRVEQERFRGKATELQDNVFEQMTNQMEKFRSNLETFAAKHRNEIKKNPAFRKQFQEMCASIGVDPLASSKGFWSELLGVGDFYYEIAVQVIEVCLATSQQNGGLITLGELRQRLVKARGKSQHHQNISNDDIIRAIKKLKVLGSGFSIISLKDTQDSSDVLIRSIPGELNADHTEVLKIAEAQAFTSVETIKSKLKWDDVRCQQILNELVRDGVAWVDEQSTKKTYWFPSFFKPLINES
ncbi:vacuolar-sorting protein SNF8-like [Daphnia carinata]|uniref:vacuolar-sorting protein SNF8-like n=1 Tax=Daphnia carinata TaxID=120202 RepID=UPI00258068E9|nr:vacuolar-sorting protein SNF8-like [Daphnia carinata]